MRAIRTYLAVLLAAAALGVSAAPPALAGLLTFQKDFTYSSGALDTEDTSRVVASARARTMLLHEIARRLGSRYAGPEAVALLGGLVAVQETGQRWSSGRFSISVRAVVEAGLLGDALDDLLADPGRRKDLRALRHRALHAMDDIERFNSAPASTAGRFVRFDAAVRRLAATIWDQRGFVALAEGDYPAAVDAFGSAIVLGPGDEIAYYNRGVARWLMEEFREAEGDFRRALDLDPEYGRAASSLEQAREYFQRFRDTVGYYDRLLKGSPDDAAAYYERGLAHWELGNYDQTVKDFTKVIELRPDIEDGYLNRGGVYMGLQQYDLAIRDFALAIGINPKNTAPHFNMALAYVRTGRFQDALGAFGRAIELDPADAQAHFNRAALYDQVGDHERAVRDMAAAAALGHPGALGYLREQGIRQPPRARQRTAGEDVIVQEGAGAGELAGLKPAAQVAALVAEWKRKSPPRGLVRIEDEKPAPAEALPAVVEAKPAVVEKPPIEEKSLVKEDAPLKEKALAREAKPAPVKAARPLAQEKPPVKEGGLDKPGMVAEEMRALKKEMRAELLGAEKARPQAKVKARPLIKKKPAVRPLVKAEAQPPAKVAAPPATEDKKPVKAEAPATARPKPVPSGKQKEGRARPGRLVPSYQEVVGQAARFQTREEARPSMKEKALEEAEAPGLVSEAGIKRYAPDMISNAAAGGAGGKVFMVQTEAFADPANAEVRVRRLRDAGYPQTYMKQSRINGSATVYLVIVDEFKQREQAQELVDRLKKKSRIISFISVTQ